ncbi:uncharacterized protein SPAPADRAFT_59605 [Spathaspora passalidarum NRRL Y-27907]|uniref:Transmembrane protein 14 n=1 Tax=Spathaspora passalidarum (strain NRRL Y-27907 / 11-Y1) TaxID=619300 RepID=G3AHK4_SPAPN|nr:uncharacterized protein SPAPADRAFT_59605 [Spathaspora passalidarum NRRL Y-27907]EGW34168.1 hypothetical protein SPAPADRAFT_59605 [Spathaspora passalidarum NRRL Y-27907]
MGMDHPAFTLAGLTAIGGIMGYARKGSVPSLVAGITFSALYGTAGYLLKQNADYGLELALGTSAVLLVAGLARSIPTSFKKPLPVVLVALGGASTAYYAKRYNDFYSVV